MAVESATRYLKTYGAVAVGLLSLVVAFNVVVDPYGVLPAMSVAGLNAHKPREVRFELQRRARGLLGQLLHRRLGLPGQIQDAARRDLAFGLEPALVQVRVRLRVDRQLAGPPHAAAVQLRVQIQIRRRARALHGHGEIGHPAQAEIARQEEVGQVLQEIGRAHV